MQLARSDDLLSRAQRPPLSCGCESGKTHRLRNGRHFKTSSVEGPTSIFPALEWHASLAITLCPSQTPGGARLILCWLWQSEDRPLACASPRFTRGMGGWRDESEVLKMEQE